jgi:hypothetical protein
VAVVDGDWWALSWPWMIVWMVTALALLVCGWLLVAGGRRARGAVGGTHNGVVGVCVYLHEQLVMDLYQSSSLAKPLQQRVRRRVVRGSRFRLVGMFFNFFPGAERSVSDEVLRSYIEEASPITVIRPIADELEKRDEILYADLRKGRIARNKASRNVLSADSDEQSAALVLSDIDSFVWVKGRFHTRGEGLPSKVVFLVPYESSASGDGTDAFARITCFTSDFRHKNGSNGPFQARCLGKVGHWDPGTGQLEIDPVAIFK